MESGVSLGGKERRTNQLKSWQSRGSNWEPCGRKAENLPTAPNMPAKEFADNRKVPFKMIDQRPLHKISRNQNEQRKTN